MNRLMRLKSGTDIRGVAIADDESKVELNDITVKKIGAAFARWLTVRTKAKRLKIAVGHDSRISCPRIKKALIDSLVEQGVHVYDCGLSSTPSMYMVTVSGAQVDGSVEITASHHPYDKNGLKFFTSDGGLDSIDIEEILKLAAKPKEAAKKAGKCTKYDFMTAYSAHLREMICREVNSADNYEKPLEGLKIIVDAGNGVGGFYVSDVLEPLGADCSGSRFLEPDGHFPNHIPNPENEAAMESACEATVSASADLGIIFDTDVDRMGCVDNSGKEINRNRLIALASVIALENCKGATVVTDSVTSDGLRDFIEKQLKSKQLRYKRGYKNVINKSIELNEHGVESPLAIETSGHAALKENAFLDDGAYLATKIVIKLAVMRKIGKSLDSLISTLKEPAESEELRFKILKDDFRRYGSKVLDDLKEYAVSRKNWEVENENYEGVRINVPNGWFLLRLSVHDPILPLNIEFAQKGNIAALLTELKPFFERYDFLDLSAFDKYL